MSALLEAVPNISDGRDPELLEALAAAVRAAGAELLDASGDPDHHRSVLTFIGSPERVEAASLAVAEIACDRIDLREHRGVHPRIGALDVLPIVPLAGTPSAVAQRSARRVGAGLEALGIPVYWYADSSTPPGRGLAELRRGGVEALRDGWPEGRHPDLDAGRDRPHPSAGATCVGARPLLLAWNVFVEGVGEGVAREIARSLREVGGGFPGVRALALPLESSGRLQISMNLERVEGRDPWAVFRALEDRVEEAGGRVVETEVIGMIPDALVLPAAADRLRLYGATPSRLLSRRIAEHRAAHPAADDAAAVAAWCEGREDVPDSIREAAARLRGLSDPLPVFSDPR